MSKRCYFTIADNNNLVHYEKLKNSLLKFDSDTELKLIGDDFANTFGGKVFYYRAKPIVALGLMNDGYDEVCGLDADQIITGDISDIWNGDYDVATVRNNPSYQINLWDISPYFNNGLVVLKNKKFVEHWMRLCHSVHFDHYQFREQDLLNILCSDYNNYKVRDLDVGDKYYGESAKPLWSTAELKDNKIMIGDKQLNVIHFGGGEQGIKGNYRIKFNEEIVNYIDKLIK